HDTVCFVCKDENDLISACSTSGLFMKEDGRLGDTPIVGCGYYADSKIGAASATGVGEEISRGMISYETVRLMSEGCSAMDACQKALAKLNAKMDRELLSISVIALDANGNYGVATNCDFAFSYASENCEPKAYFVNSKNEIRELNENDIID
ncbi:MAG: isoaspartyl peptidase/L-asparaginase, partial [Erysipelotrichaceae bacterium]|nr:isoaspartyl peptidase/L-asparaginase [Erysipelotrichaceae bacterium]